MKLVHCFFVNFFIINYLSFAVCFLVPPQSRLNWLDSSLIFNIISLIAFSCYLVFFVACRCRAQLEKGFFVDLARVVAALLLTLCLALITLRLISELSGAA